jgi:GxxExxY protein
LKYKGVDLSVSYRIDILVAETVVVEVKAVEKVLPIHEAQLLTYLKLGGYQVGLLLNFNVPQLRDGIVRKVLGLQEE